MKLYYGKGTCSLAVHIAIEEMQIPCEYIQVDLSTKKCEDGSDYFTVNPKGAVPCLVTDEGKILTENIIIQLYLNDHYAKQSTHDFKHYEIFAAYNFVSTDLHKGIFSPIFNSQVSAEEKDRVFKPMLGKKLDYIANVLKSHPYFCGEHFTIADAYLFTVFRWAINLKISISNWPILVDYINRLRKHPSIERALNAEGIEVKEIA